MTEIVTEIEQIKNEKQLMKKELGDLLTQLQTLQEKIKQIMDPHVAKIQEHEDNIRNLILMDEKSFEGDDGSKVTFRKESIRHSWDDKALMGYIAAGHDEIMQFRKETVVRPSVSIKIAEVE